MSTTIAKTRTVPSTLESAQSKLVYVYLQHERETTVDALSEALDIRKIGLFSVLSTLESENLVEREEAHTVRFTN